MTSNAIARGALRALEGAGSGTLRLVTPQGERHTFGQGGPEAEIVVRDWRVAAAMLAHGDVGFGEAYVAGWWDSPDIEAVTAFGLRNREALGGHIGGNAFARGLAGVADAALRANTRAGARRNIRAHYDVGNEFYRLWLDEGMTYSSALYTGENDTLDAAQDRKYARLLDVTRGDNARTLEIGCGWGGFAERAAQEGREVTALTISRAQYEYAQARLGGRAQVRLQDYRDAGGRFDAIVSIEMIEAVGERYWPTYFRTIKRRLAEGGTAAIQAITVSDAAFPTYRRRPDFVRRHVFPGGTLIPPGRIRAEAARAGLVAQNMVHFGDCYARTLREWLARFEAAGPRVRALGHGEAFVRCWRFYLASCAALFAAGRTDVVQVELRHA